jgi:hypothetical protein
MNNIFSLVEPFLICSCDALIALPLMSCLSLLLKLGRTPRDKVSHIFTFEALDVSQISFLNLIFSHHLGILDLHWMPCSTTTSCFLLHHHQVIIIIFVIDLDLSLGCDFLVKVWLWLRFFLLLH